MALRMPRAWRVTTRTLRPSLSHCPSADARGPSFTQVWTRSNDIWQLSCTRWARRPALSFSCCALSFDSWRKEEGQARRQRGLRGRAQGGGKKAMSKHSARKAVKRFAQRLVACRFQSVQVFPHGPYSESTGHQAGSDPQPQPVCRVSHNLCKGAEQGAQIHHLE